MPEAVEEMVDEETPPAPPPTAKEDDGWAAAAALLLGAVEMALLLLWLAGKLLVVELSVMSVARLLLGSADMFFFWRGGKRGFGWKGGSVCVCECLHTLIGSSAKFFFMN